MLWSCKYLLIVMNEWVLIVDIIQFGYNSSQSRAKFLELQTCFDQRISLGISQSIIPSDLVKIWPLTLDAAFQICLKFSLTWLIDKKIWERNFFYYFHTKKPEAYIQSLPAFFWGGGQRLL